MFVFADKTNKRKTDSTMCKSATRQKRSIPMYVLDNLPEQDSLGNVGSVVQRCSVGVRARKLVTPRRPPVPKSAPFRNSLCRRINDSECLNPFEMDFKKNHKNPAAMSKALGRRGRYRSREGCAFCHKVSIHDIQERLNHYADTGEMPVEFKTYLGMIGADIKMLDFIAESKTREEKEALVRIFILDINLCSANYYLGDAKTNSMLGSHLDPHVDYETGMMSPISEYAFDHQEQMGITPAKSDGYDGFYTSSLPH